MQQSTSEQRPGKAGIAYEVPLGSAFVSIILILTGVWLNSRDRTGFTVGHLTAHGIGIADVQRSSTANLANAGSWRLSSFASLPFYGHLPIFSRLDRSHPDREI